MIEYENLLFNDFSLRNIIKRKTLNINIAHIIPFCVFKVKSLLN